MVLARPIRDCGPPSRDKGEIRNSVVSDVRHLPSSSKRVRAAGSGPSCALCSLFLEHREASRDREAGPVIIRWDEIGPGHGYAKADARASAGAMPAPVPEVRDQRSEIRKGKRRPGGRERSPLTSDLRHLISARGLAACLGLGAGAAREGHLVDALAPRGDEGRGTLRKAEGKCEQLLILGSPNGATHRFGGSLW